MATDYISKRLGELQEQLQEDAEMVVRGIPGALRCLESDVEQIKDLAQRQKERLLRKKR